jgi:hypothetical protein
MKDMQRPIAAHEVEQWIAQNNTELAKELSTKCYDYVRIILSLTPRDTIMKFKCDVSFPGVDRRAAFYGLPDWNYDPAIWRAIGGKNGKRRQVRKEAVKQTPPAAPEKKSEPAKIVVPSLFGGPEVKRSIRMVDERACESAWFALTTFVPPNDDFWQTFMDAIQQMKRGVQDQRDPEEVLNQILKERPNLTNPVIFSDVLDILSKEAVLEQEAIIFDSFDSMFF